MEQQVITPIASTQSTHTARAILARASFFGHLTPEQNEQVARVSRLQEFASGSQIYTVGDRAVDIYVLVEGMVRFGLALGARRATAGQIIRRNEVFGWAALVQNAQRRIATASCMTPCQTLTVNGDRLLAIMDADHSLGYAVMTQLTVLITSTLTAFAAG